MPNKSFDDINCPACGEKMKQVYLNSQKITVDICEKCGGIYFDNRELEKCDESFENASEIFNFLEGKNFIDVDTTQMRECPVCGQNMVKNATNFKKTVEIDVCYSCGGKFLDRGELEKIREQNNTKGEGEEKIINDVLLNSYEIEEKYALNYPTQRGIPWYRIILFLIIVASIICVFVFFTIFPK